MKKLLLLVFCFLALGLSAQKKKSVQPKPKTTLTQKKVNSSASGYKTCGLCKGTGKDPRCNGTTRCQNHRVYSRIDNECFRNCQCYEADDEEWFDEDETSEECRSRCKDKCKIQEPCDYCKSIDGTCSVMWCNNGVCRNCDGKGIAYYGAEKKIKKN